MILLDVTDYRLLSGNCSIPFSPRSEKITSAITVTKRSMKTFAYVDQFMFAVLKLAWRVIV